MFIQEHIAQLRGIFQFWPVFLPICILETGFSVSGVRLAALKMTFGALEMGKYPLFSAKNHFRM
jgi:hypothetical protein